MRLAYASCRFALDLPETDLAIVQRAAETRGHELVAARWDDPAVDWTTFDRVVVRSCWDYVGRRDEFLAWAASVPGLQNSAEVLRWNTDKTYLRALAEAGVPVIETRWDVRTGDPLPEAAEIVVKPTISAGSRDTARWSEPTDAYRHSESLLAEGRPTMTQPYVASVDDEGETAMLFFGGRFSHAVRKGALLVKGEGINNERDGRGENVVRVPTERQHQVAQHALDVAQDLVGETFLYARVDLVTDDAGEPMLIELELTEPFFFLDMVEEGATHLIQAIETS